MSAYAHQIEPVAPFAGLVSPGIWPMHARRANFDCQVGIGRNQQGKSALVCDVSKLARLPYTVPCPEVTVKNAPACGKVFCN